jgi:hypothetical protein
MFWLLDTGLEAAPRDRALLSTPVGESEEEDANKCVGLGHTLLYTNCSEEPLQVVADPALNVPFR